MTLLEADGSFLKDELLEQDTPKRTHLGVPLYEREAVAIPQTAPAAHSWLGVEGRYSWIVVKTCYLKSNDRSLLFS